MSLSIGEGRYILGEPLGEGRFAIVYRTQDTHLDRPVALKLLREEHVGGDPKWREAFDIEVELLKALADLPTVVTMLDHGTASDGRPYIGLELLPPGTDLLTRVTHQSRLSEEDGLPIAWQLADLLRTAHARDIAYRDLKLEHIFWSDGRMTLIDWNVSRRFVTNNPQEHLDVSWEKEWNFQGDLFKFGTILYSMFTGIDIRSRQIPTPVYSQLRESGYNVTDEGIVWPIDFPDVALSPELKEIILRLVHIDLNERYQSAEAVCAALEKRAHQLGVEVTRPVKEPTKLPAPIVSHPPKDDIVTRMKEWLARLSNKWWGTARR